MKQPNRKPNRLAGWDYSQKGVYFIPICTKDKAHLFGRICDGILVPTELGYLAQAELLALEQHRPNLKLHHWVVMPNHVHILLELTAGAGLRRDTTCRVRHTGNPNTRVFGAPIPDSVSTIISGYKAAVTRKWRQHLSLVCTPPQSADKTSHVPTPIWQTRFHDHIVRNDADFRRIWDYIDTTPSKWAEDCYYYKGTD